MYDIAIHWLLLDCACSARDICLLGCGVGCVTLAVCVGTTGAVGDCVGSFDGNILIHFVIVGSTVVCATDHIHVRAF